LLRFATFFACGCSCIFHKTFVKKTFVNKGKKVSGAAHVITSGKKLPFSTEIMAMLRKKLKGNIFVNIVCHMKQNMMKI